MKELGYILLWRKIMESSFYTDPLCCHLAIHLLLRANHKPRKVMIGQEEVKVERGQLITGRKKLSEETGISQQSVRTNLKKLKNQNFLTNKSTNKYSLITITNYEDYQTNLTSKLTTNLTSNQPALNQQLTSNQPLTKNVKNVKNVKEITILSQIKNLLATFPSRIQGIIENYWKQVAYNNKSKRITDGRRLTLLNEIYNAYQRCKDDELFIYAMEESIARDACCIGYINAIIRKRKIQSGAYERAKTEKMLRKAKKEAEENPPTKAQLAKFEELKGKIGKPIP